MATVPTPAPRRTDIADLDVKLADLEARTSPPPADPQVLRDAIAREAALASDGQVAALSCSLHLVLHPEVAVSTDADYPGWTPGGAS